MNNNINKNTARSRAYRDSLKAPFQKENKEAKELSDIARQNVIDNIWGLKVWEVTPEFRQAWLVAEEMRKLKGEGRYFSNKKKYIPINLLKYEEELQFKN